MTKRLVPHFNSFIVFLHNNLATKLWTAESLPRRNKNLFLVKGFGSEHIHDSWPHFLTPKPHGSTWYSALSLHVPLKVAWQQIYAALSLGCSSGEGLDGSNKNRTNIVTNVFCIQTTGNKVTYYLKLLLQVQNCIKYSFRALYQAHLFSYGMCQKEYYRTLHFSATGFYFKTKEVKPSSPLKNCEEWK